MYVTIPVEFEIIDPVGARYMADAKLDVQISDEADPKSQDMLLVEVATGFASKFYERAMDIRNLKRTNQPPAARDARL